MPGITDHDPGTGDHDQRNTHQDAPDVVIEIKYHLVSHLHARHIVEVGELYPNLLFEGLHSALVAG